MGGPYDAAENQPLSVRCIIMDRIGPPMLAGAYNNNYQIVQVPGYVMILVEMIHDVRIIPLDGRPHLPQQVRQWTGSYRGRWEGDTLVVETTNFTDKVAIGSNGAGYPGDPGYHSQALRLTERFTRNGPDTILYKFTMEDPSTFVAPFSGELPFNRLDEQVYEYACHEGNYGLANILRAQRVQDAKAAGSK